jgi:hypothetical protein
MGVDPQDSTHQGIAANPGLAAFALDFTQHDNPVSRIGVGFFKEPYPGWVLESYYGDNAYTWAIDGQELPAGASYRFLDAEGCNPSDVDPFVSLGTPVLVGFSMSSSGRDQHVRKIGVQVERASGGFRYSLTMEDDGGCVPIVYRLVYALVPVVNAGPVQTWISFSPGGKADLPIHAVAPVLRGFLLEFENGEHNLDELKVQLTPTLARVVFDDDSRREPFSFRVHWVDVATP